MIHKRTMSVLLTLLAVMGVSFVASAQECYRSTDCAGDLVCLNRSCVTPEIPLVACKGGDDLCDWNEVCHDGYCKIEGIICTNDWGQCVIDQSSGECECAGGDGSGWASSSDPTNPAPPTPDAELYMECREYVNMECEEPPKPEDYCTTENKTVCTDWALKELALDENCWEADTPVARPDSASVDEKSVGGEVAFDDEVRTPVINTDNLPKMAAQEQDVLWDIAECCEELEEIQQDPEEAAIVDQYLQCVTLLSDTDCEGWEQCEEIFDEGDSAGMDKMPDNRTVEHGEGGTTDDLSPSLPESDNGAADGSGSVDESESVGQSNTNSADSGNVDTGAAEDGTTADEGGAATPEGEKGKDTTNDKSLDGDDDSGCSFVPVKRQGKLVSLFKVLF